MLQELLIPTTLLILSAAMYLLMRCRLLALCLLASSAHAAIAHVAGSDGQNRTASGTSVVVTLGSASSTGDLIICALGLVSGSVNPTVTDSASQVYLSGGSGNNSTSSFAKIWYFPNSVSGVTSVTASISPAAAIAMGCGRFTGAAATNTLDATAATTNTGTGTAPSGTAFVPTSSNDVIIAAEADNSGANQTAAGGATLLYSQIEASLTGAGEWKIISGNPSTTMSFGTGTTNWVVVTAAFVPAAASGGVSKGSKLRKLADEF